jgi:murein DD-endopeptidase MepM/ murein hydrolase activator NlpD
MRIRHRRRSVHAEAIAPWASLSVILLIWWAGARVLQWARPLDQVKPEPVLVSAPARGAKMPSPTISAKTVVRGSDIEDLRSRSLAIPVRGLDAEDLVSSFDDARGASRRHEAIDILAPRGTDVLAVEDGTVAKLFTSVTGGLTIYQYEPSARFVYYYAHLDAYAPGLKEGDSLRKGDVIGRVGTTGNAPESTPHLHFAISKLDPDRRWWGGTALDPYLVWRDPSDS